MEGVSAQNGGRIAAYGAKKKMDELQLVGFTRDVKFADASGNAYNFDSTEYNIPTRVQNKTSGTFVVGQIATSGSGAVFIPSGRTVNGTLIGWGRTSDSGQPYGIVEQYDPTTNTSETIYVIGQNVENTIRDISKTEGYTWNYGGRQDDLNSPNVPTQDNGDKLNLNENNGWKKIN